MTQLKFIALLSSAIAIGACSHTTVLPQDSDATQTQISAGKGNWEIEKKMDPSIYSTLRIVRDRRETSSELVLNRFKTTLVNMEPQESRRHAELLAKSNTSQSILDLYADAQEWRSKFDSLTASQLLKLAKPLLEGANDLSKSEELRLSRESFAGRLLLHGWQRGSVEAYYLYAHWAIRQSFMQIVVPGRDWFEWAPGIITLGELAKKNHAQTLLDLFRFYRDGIAVDRNFVKSYYWGQRVLAQGVDVKLEHYIVGQKLSDEDREMVQRWLDNNNVPELP